MEYDFKKIEAEWKKYWNDNHVYKVSNESDKPKCYVLDMFPYPSGAGLHVGHPLGYIASDIYARYKRLKGFNVLHPMGFDAFGLPAEQYAIETGQHPAVTTEKNIARYREQLDNIGFCYDWSREVRTSDPKYYKWTQWIFLQLFHSWYDHKADKARPVSELIALFEKEGNQNVACPGNETLHFDALKWNDFSEKEKREALMQYRLAYQGYAQVWWCEALGTVLANDEVVNGVSERGGHPVERKNMRQWFLRITEYAERLLASLDTLDWTEPMKEMQRNWIGKSVGAEVRFGLSFKPSGKGDNAVIDLTPALSGGEGAESGQSTITQSREDGFKSMQSTLNDNSRDQRGTQGWNTADPNVYKLIAPFRQELKDNLTEAENLLWQEIRGNKLGVKFRRQHVIGRFIGDFVCLTHNLIVEVDGKIHEQQKTEDALRTENLELRGFKIIRFTNEEVYKNISSVLNKIKQELNIHESSSVRNYLAGNNTLSSGEGRGEVSTGNDPIIVNNISSPTGNNSISKGDGAITVFTTRPDTIFGVDFMVLAPEHELVDNITTEVQKEAINNYKTYVKSRSERERMSEVKQVTGCFTGAYARHPLTNKNIPIWISEYVLAGYGTGAIMAVPSGDDRDHAFARHFGIPITNIFGDKYTGEEAYSAKTGTIENSDFLSGMSIAEASEAAIDELVDEVAGKRKVNYKLRDAGFSRQRYWGEPFPIIYVDDIPYGIDEPIIHNEHKLGSLPVELPMVAHYKPGPEGQGPLANIEDWVETDAGERETNTMPGYAGSSWYFLRYMDPHNNTEFASRKATDYWNQVDVYIGGNEHAVGHLLYSRMWTKAVYDLGHIGFDEPFKKMLNQGMIQGSTRFVYRVNGGNQFVSAGLRKQYDVHELRVDVNIVDGLDLDIEAFKKWRPDYADAEFILEDGKYLCGSEIEKMSKSKYNVVNPDDIVAQYGADTFRMYEMFLGPIDVSKPWDTKGIEGVHRFLKKLWRLYADEQKGWIVNDEAPTNDELRILHKTIKKIEEDVERFAFNTSVSQFMICVNELTALSCHKRGILEPLALTICPFAPHIAEQLWHQLGHTTSVISANFPKYEEQYTRENSKVYPIAINGRTRLEMEFPLDAQKATIEQAVMADENVVKWMEGKPLKKFIFVEGKMINVVV